MKKCALFSSTLLIQSIDQASSFLSGKCSLTYQKRNLLTHEAESDVQSHLERLSCCALQTTPLNNNLSLSHRVNDRRAKKFELYSAKEYDGWVAGDVQMDLQTLRSAVARSNAGTDLDEKERIHLLNEFAKQRRELIPDVKRYILRPLFLAAFIISLLPISSFLSSVSGGGRHSYVYLGQVVKYFIRAFFGTMNASYFISITAPFALYHYSKATIVAQHRQKYTIPVIDTIEHLTTSSDDRDCSDCSQCLLETWISSIFFSAVLHGLMVLSSMMFYGRNVNRIPSLQVPNILLFEFGLRLSRFTTRLGAAASLHQFPKLLYELRRSNQPRPIALLPTLMNGMVDAYLYILPLGFVADIAQLFLLSSPLSGTYATKLNSIVCHRHLFFSRAIYASLLLSIIVPVVHLIALKKIVRIGHFTNISLAMNQDKALELLDQEDTDGFKLRYKLQWRPPIRLFSSGTRLIRKFTLFFFSGWGDKASIVDSTVPSNASAGEKEPFILNLLGKELENNSCPKFRERKNWIQHSSNNMANIHQTNYINKKFDDPLGIAFQQTFGIGLSFDFDHNSKLEKGKSASVHRLRARAAKSAIKEYNDIAQIVEKQVQSIADDGERAVAYEKLMKEKKEDMMQVAMEISKLIPTNAPAPEGKDLDVFAMKQSEANHLDSVSLPWLQDSSSNKSKSKSNENIFDDPYLSFEDAFLYDMNRKSKELELLDGESEEIFNSNKTVLT